MKLYATEMSPFSTRVTIQLAIKDLPIKVLPPPFPLRTPEFKERYIIGKVPILESGDDYLAESVAIMEFLEDEYPDVPLRAEDAWERGQGRMRCRFVDQELGPSMAPLFFAVFAPGGEAPSTDPAHAQLKTLERLMGDWNHDGLRLEDIVLATSFYYMIELLELAGSSPDMNDLPLIQTWWQKVLGVPEVAHGIESIDAAFKGFLSVNG